MKDLNGAGIRACPDGWIKAFISHAENLESAEIFRLWTGITTISAVLERKVWLQTSSPQYPNLYVFIVGDPGIGKTRSIIRAADFLRTIPEFHIAPNKLSAASLIDVMVDSHRFIPQLPDEPLDYHSLTIVADDLSAFMAKWDLDMVGNLTVFWDCTPFYERKRHLDSKGQKPKMPRPQLTILCGATPSGLLQMLPENAWYEGFTTRVIMIYSNEKIISDDLFANIFTNLPDDMLHDLKIINSLTGGFKVTQDYKNAINNWRKLGMPPVPTHPKLTHYCSRRLTQIFKLSMISCVDKTNTLLLTKEDFNRAMGWLLEAESAMPEIFRTGTGTTDARAMDELAHYCQVLDKGQGIPETRLIRRAGELVPVMAVRGLIEVMTQSGLLKLCRVDRGVRFFRAPPRE